MQEYDEKIKKSSRYACQYDKSNLRIWIKTTISIKHMITNKQMLFDTVWHNPTAAHTLSHSDSQQWRECSVTNV